MKMNRWSLVLACASSAAPAWAQDVEANEDPFAEDRPKEEGDGEPREGETDGQRSEAEGGDAEATKSERTFGRKGDVAIGVERLVGVARTKQQTEVVGGPDLEVDVTRRHALMNSGGRDFLGYSAPRLGFDWFPWEGVSAGIAIGGSADTGPYDYRQYTIAPRVGYAHMFGKVVGAWGRVGLTYQDNKADDVKTALLAAGGVLDLVLVPTKNVVVLVGPRFDASLIGKLDRPDEDKVDLAVSELGFSAGFGVFF